MQQVAEQAAEMGGDLKKFNRYVYPSMRRTQVRKSSLAITAAQASPQALLERKLANMSSTHLESGLCERFEARCS